MWIIPTFLSLSIQLFLKGERKKEKKKKRTVKQVEKELKTHNLRLLGSAPDLCQSVRVRVPKDR